MLARLLRAAYLFQHACIVICSRPEVELEVHSARRPIPMTRSNVLPGKDMQQGKELLSCQKFSEGICQDRCYHRACDLCPSGKGCSPNVCPDRNSQMDDFDFGYTDNWPEELCSLLKEKGYTRENEIIILTSEFAQSNICKPNGEKSQTKCGDSCWNGKSLSFEGKDIGSALFPLHIFVEDPKKNNECERMCTDINSCFRSQVHSSSDACQPLTKDWKSVMIGNAKEPKALWTGGIGASMRARLNGHPTLESNSVAQAIMAVVGSCIEFSAEGMVPYDVWQNHYAGLFNTISVDFVNMMESNVIHIYFTDIDPNKTLMVQELPSIAKNTHIETAVFHPLVDKKTGTKVKGMANNPDEITELASVTMLLERNSQNPAQIQSALEAKAKELRNSLPS